MNLDRYNFTTETTHSIYEFISEGQNGKIEGYCNGWVPFQKGRYYKAFSIKREKA